METTELIFDEVDVGHQYRPIAAIVGRLLRQLGKSTQVMCVLRTCRKYQDADISIYLSANRLTAPQPKYRLHYWINVPVYKKWRVCSAAVKSPEIPWQMQKNYLLHKSDVAAI